MAVRAYEAMVIFNPEFDEAGLRAAAESVTGLIAAQGGQVEKLDTWGRRRMYYPIKQFRDGNYVVIEFQAEPRTIRDLEASLRLREDVLRHLVIRRDE